MKKDNNYKIYKKKLSKKEYYDNWDSDNYNNLTSELKSQIYEKYLIKCEVFQRDNFTCQSKNCLKNGTPLTLHHIKFQKNGGKDSVKNGVTLCETCHRSFHRGKKHLTLLNNKSLPNHIRGHTFKLSNEEKVNWVKVKSDMRKLRKTIIRGDDIKKLKFEDIAELIKIFEMWLSR